jgi:hypothetical protein
MNLASSQVASCSDMFSQCISHCGTTMSYPPIVRGIYRLCNTARGVVLALPSEVTNGREAFGTTVLPRCFLADWHGKRHGVVFPVVDVIGMQHVPLSSWHGMDHTIWRWASRNSSVLVQFRDKVAFSNIPCRLLQNCAMSCWGLQTSSSFDVLVEGCVVRSWACDPSQQWWFACPLPHCRE